MKRTFVYLAPMLQFSCWFIFSFFCPSSRILNVIIRDRNWKITGKELENSLTLVFFHCFCSYISLPRWETCPLLIAKGSPHSHGSVSWAASSLSFWSLSPGWPRVVAPAQLGGGRRWHWQGWSPACYSREKLSRVKMQHCFLWTSPGVMSRCMVLCSQTCFVLDGYQVQWAAVFLAMYFNLVWWCSEIPTCSQFLSGISGGASGKMESDSQYVAPSSFVCCLW